MTRNRTHSSKLFTDNFNEKLWVNDPSRSDLLVLCQLCNRAYGWHSSEDDACLPNPKRVGDNRQKFVPVDLDGQRVMML